MSFFTLLKSFPISRPRLSSIHIDTDTAELNKRIKSHAMMQVAYTTTMGAVHAQAPVMGGQQYVAQQQYHEESSASASASSVEREQGSMSSSSSSSGILSTRLPDNWQTPVVKFRVRRTVTKKSTHPIAEARLKKEREEKAKAAQKANGGGKRQNGGNGGGKRRTDGGNIVNQPKRPALPTMPKVANLCAGMEVTGMVTSVHEFGVFMDIGWKRDALLHKSEVCNKGSCDPFFEFQVGQKFAAWIVDIFEGDDTRPARAGLSLVSPTGKMYFDDLSVGDAFVGEVSRVLPFGLIVEFGAQVDGMVHQSELYDLPEDFNVGDTLNVEVKYLDQEARRVSLRLPAESGNNTAPTSTPVETKPQWKSAAAPSTGDKSKSQKPLSKSAKRRLRKQKLQASN